MQKAGLVMRRLRLEPRKRLFGSDPGNHGTRFLGEGYDFAELRPYTLDDDVRHIDWMVTAKLGVPFVKRYYEEHALDVTLVMLPGPGLLFGRDRSRQEAMAEAARLLAQSAVAGGDRVGMTLCLGERVKEVPLSGRHTAWERIEALAMDPAAVQGYQTASNLEAVARKLSRPSLLFLLGDFMTLPTLPAALRPHDLTALVFQDPLERDLPPLGLSSFPGNRSGWIGNKSAKRYNAALKAHDEALDALFVRNGVRKITIDISGDIYRQLAVALERRG